MPQGTIRIRGARQHNLKNLDLDIRTGELTVVTVPSGSGKSSQAYTAWQLKAMPRLAIGFTMVDLAC